MRSAVTSFATGEYGNGASWVSLVADPGLSLPRVQGLASWFIVLQARQGTMSPDDRPTAKSGEAPVVTSPNALDPRFVKANGDRFVFRVHKGPASRFDFVSVGRNSGNDIYIPDESISRFHAFFRETPSSLVVVDARSHNGTAVRGARVAPQGEGEPTTLRSGDTIRFGEVTGVVYDAVALFAQLPGR